MGQTSDEGSAEFLVNVPLASSAALAETPFEVEGPAPSHEAPPCSPPFNGASNGNGKAAAAPVDKHSLVGSGEESSYQIEAGNGGGGRGARAGAVVNPHDAEPTGAWYHSAFHSVTAVVGAGVLGLPYSVRWLGWWAGMLYLGLACGVSYYTSYQLAVLHHHGGERHNRYRDLGRYVFGPRLGLWMIVPFQATVMIGLGITYTVTAGASFKGIADDLCTADTTYAECTNGVTGYIFIFGGIQVLLSQLPSFHDLGWVSLLGAAMSVGYCTIAAAASAASIGDANPGYVEGTEYSSADKVFNIFNSLGAMTFAYGGHSVLLEIQATLKEPPKASRAMMQGVSAAYVVVVVAYFAVAATGYAAFGNGVNPDVLLSIEDPKWLVDIANFMVVIHVAAGYQIFSMPVFEAWEGWMSRRQFRVADYPWLMRLIFRSAYVLFTTCVAAALPFFSDLMGLCGALGFLPCTFILPCLMWLVARRCSMVEKVANVLIIATFSCVAVVSLVGSMRNIIVHSSQYSFFD